MRDDSTRSRWSRTIRNAPANAGTQALAGFKLRGATIVNASLPRAGTMVKLKLKLTALLFESAKEYYQRVI